MTGWIGLVALSAFALAGIGLASGAALKVWRGWLEIRRLELAGRGAVAGPSPAARIELAALKERVRRLEAIASGSEG